MHDTHGIAVSRRCAAVGFARSADYHQPVAWPVRDADVMAALKELVKAHPR